MTMQEEQDLECIKYHTALPFIFSPAEQVFVLQMVSIELKKEKGIFVPRGRTEHMKQMQLTEYAFDKCITKMIKLGLLNKRNNKKMNRVYYYFNLENYNRLLKILSSTVNKDKLREFCRKNFIERTRNIDSITIHEIRKLEQG